MSLLSSLSPWFGCMPTARPQLTLFVEAEQNGKKGEVVASEQMTRRVSRDRVWIRVAVSECCFCSSDLRWARGCLR